MSGSNRVAQIGPDSIYCPPGNTKSFLGKEYHIFFITGNPGLIAYYHTFLACLSKHLSGISDGVHIYGHSLGGFEARGRGRERGHAPYGLQQQIRNVEEGLHAYVRAHESLSSREGQQATGISIHNPARIILMGHSVGAYILLELIRRHREKVLLGMQTDMEIVGGVLLFPTVTHIAKSPSGLRVGWLLKLPYFALVVSALARGVTFLLPRGVLYSLVKLITGFPAEAAETTAAFLRSPMGVRQALHMARDEMEEIIEDRWDEEIWGVSERDPDLAPSKLVFYFGKEDHWVADHTRDELMRMRAFREDQPEMWKPKMVIDEDGIPHGFCIKHSEILAKKVQKVVKDIISERA